VVVHIKDVLKYSKDRDEYTIYLRTVLQTLKKHQLHSKYKKNEHWLEALVFLEHMVSKEKIKIVLHKAKAVTKCPKPTNTLRLETFWVLAGHYQVSGRICQILSSLTNLLKQATKLARRFGGTLSLPTVQVL